MASPIYVLFLQEDPAEKWIDQVRGKLDRKSLRSKGRGAAVDII